MTWCGLVLLLAATCLVGFVIDGRADSEEWRKAQQLLQSGQNAEAEALLERLVKKEPDNGLAWYGLALARLELGDLEGAAEANKMSSKYPAMRPEALYNLACTYGRMDELDPASDALKQAIAAGFIDYDLMRTDPDVEILRRAGRIVYPREHTYDTITARNGITLQYKVVLPRDYDPQRTYPALVSFAPGGWGPASCDWSLANLWGESTAEAGWIAVHLIAPDRGWMTHPSHHALEELLGKIQDDHHIEGKRFHLVGFGNGARPATTYAGMSMRFFQSLTTVANQAVARWDEDELKRFSQKRVFLLVGSNDTFALEINRKAQTLMREGGSDVTLTVLDGEGRIPSSLLGGGLMRYLNRNVREGSL